MMKNNKSGIFVKLVICTVIIISSLFFVNKTGSANIQHMTGLASWYSEFSPGIRKTTANMEIFDHDKLTCAIWDVPFGTKLEVTNLDNGKTIIVRVNDRGPAKRLCREGRVIDLTMGAFRRIADLNKGLINVKVRVID